MIYLLLPQLPIDLILESGGICIKMSFKNNLLINLNLINLLINLKKYLAYNNSLFFNTALRS